MVRGVSERASRAAKRRGYSVCEGVGEKVTNEESTGVLNTLTGSESNLR